VIRPIQLIIFFLLLAVMLIYFKRLRSKLIDRLIILIIGSLGLLMALVPEWSNLVANAVGVGRGVDLVIYLSIIGLVFLWLSLYTKIRDVETLQTQLVRNLAIHQAHFPDQQDGTIPPEPPEMANDISQNPRAST
jgi:hypothetical protein